VITTKSRQPAANGPWSHSSAILVRGATACISLAVSHPAISSGACRRARPHVGTTDIALVIGLAVEDESPEAYRTLENNLKKAQFEAENSFRWTKDVEGVTVILEFLCETDQVDAGRIFKPKQGAGSGLGAFNVRGAQLVTRDYFDCVIEADRLADGGRSRVTVRVANILSYTVLKILAFQDRHENKDSYDLIYCLLNFQDGP
jgi:hypothetical protein